MKVNDIVRFWLPNDGSGMLSNRCCGIEPQNDCFEIEFYLEKRRGIVRKKVKKSIIVQLFVNDGENRKFFHLIDLSRKAINCRINLVKDKLDWYGIPLDNFLLEQEIYSLDIMYNIEIIKEVECE